jgi:putative addiction module component (TIGR02574 family)
MLQSQEILEAALQLPQEQREVLVDKLAASLELGDLGEYWEGEIQRRIQEVDAGKVATISADEVFARLEQRFGGDFPLTREEESGLEEAARSLDRGEGLAPDEFRAELEGRSRR